jgi:hypothetical protein
LRRAPDDRLADARRHVENPLAARRRGCAVRLSGARAELLSLVALLGLADVLGE